MGNLWWIPVGISILGLLPVAFLMLDRLRKRDPDLIDRAMHMVELQEKQSGQLRQDLLQTKDTVNNLNYELTQANNQIITLNRQLSEAQDEVIYLRAQVRALTQQVDRDRNGKS